MTVILMDPRRPTLVPVDAVGFLGGDVQYTEELPIAVAWSLPGARPVLLTEGPEDNPAPVLLSSRLPAAVPGAGAVSGVEGAVVQAARMLAERSAVRRGLSRLGFMAILLCSAGS